MIWFFYVYIYIYPIIQYESNRLGNDDRVDRRGFIKQHWIYQIIIKRYFSKSCQNQRNDIMSISFFISNDIIPYWFRPYSWVLSMSNLRVTYGGTWWKRVLVVKYWPQAFLAPHLLLVVGGCFQRMDLSSRGMASFLRKVAPNRWSSVHFCCCRVAKKSCLMKLNNFRLKFSDLRCWA